MTWGKTGGKIGSVGRPWVSAARYVEDYGARGDGVTDSTVAFQAAATAGATVHMKPGGDYVISSRILMAAGFRLIGDRTNTILLTDAFNNVSLDIAQRYGTNAVAFYATGLQSGAFTPLDTIRLEGFVIRPLTTLAGKVVDGVSLLNVKNAKVSGLEMSGLSLAKGVRGATLSGDSAIEDCYIHDFTDNTNWGGGVPQITGIELDNDEVNGVASVGVRVINNRIWDLTVGATFLAAHGYQTDGINGAGKLSSTSAATDGCSVQGNDIRRVGEGVDWFGDNSLIAGNLAEDCYIYGLKLIHGASWNVVANNVVRRAGLASIVLAGTSVAGCKDTKRNSISGNACRDLDPNSVWAASSTANIAVIDNGGATGKPISNNINGNILDAGANGKYNYLDTSTGSLNAANANHIVGAGTTKRVSNAGASRYRDARPTNCRVYLNTAQNALLGATTKILFDAVSYDDRSEWDAANNRWLCQIDGRVSVSAKTRFGTKSTTKIISINIYKNNVLQSAFGTDSVETSDVMEIVADDIVVVAGDFIDIRVTSTDISDRAMTVGSAYTSMIIRET